MHLGDDLKVLILESKNQELSQNIPVSPLISQLDAEDEEITGLVCRILCVIIKTSDSESILERFAELLISACVNFDSIVPVVVIEALKLGLLPEFQERLVFLKFILSVVFIFICLGSVILLCCFF